jgi:hypothetical protein
VAKEAQLTTLIAQVDHRPRHNLGQSPCNLSSTKEGISRGFKAGLMTHLDLGESCNRASTIGRLYSAPNDPIKPHHKDEPEYNSSSMLSSGQIKMCSLGSRRTCPGSQGGNRAQIGSTSWCSTSQTKTKMLYTREESRHMR